jgi:hypothetical protein
MTEQEAAQRRRQSECSTATDELLTEKEAARLRRQSVRTLQAERLRGGGCRYVKIGRSVRYWRADVLAHINAGLRNSTSDRP